MNEFKLVVPKQAVGASLVYFDLFNASGSGYELDVKSVLPIVSGAVSVVGTVAVDLFLTRTSAVGTGGTAATAESSTLTAATFVSMSGLAGTVPNGITARLTPTGGATAGAVLGFSSLFTEETNSASYMGTLNEMWKRTPDYPSLIVPENTGLRVVQGAVASVGNIAFEVIFGVRPRV